MDDSEAALASIKALQKRIKWLEADQENLKADYESLTRQLDRQNEDHSGRERSLSEANERAQGMLTDLSATLAEVLSTRELNERLKLEIAESEEILGKQRAKNLRLKRDVSEYSAEFNETLAQLSEHEQFLAELCVPPPYSTLIPPEDLLLLASGDLEQGLLPPAFEEVHNRLRELPKSFPAQDLPTKIEIVETIGVAKAGAQEMLRRIRFLEKRRFASTSPRQFESNARVLAKQQFVLCNDIKQFRFK
jgi:hypothetical protein